MAVSNSTTRAFAVEKGNSFADIAAAHGLTTEQLALLNPRYANISARQNLPVGDRLRVPRERLNLNPPVNRGVPIAAPGKKGAIGGLNRSEPAVSILGPRGEITARAKVTARRGLDGFAELGARYTRLIDRGTGSLRPRKGKYGPAKSIANEQLARALNRLGYGPVSVGGAFKASLSAAVKKLQKKHGLSAEGVVGVQTLTRIGIELLTEEQKDKRIGGQKGKLNGAYPVRVGQAQPGEPEAVRHARAYMRVLVKTDPKAATRWINGSSRIRKPIDVDREILDRLVAEFAALGFPLTTKNTENLNAGSSATQTVDYDSAKGLMFLLRSLRHEQAQKKGTGIYTRKYDSVIREACVAAGLSDPALIKAMIMAETGFRARKSVVSAKGLMQLMPPATQEGLRYTAYGRKNDPSPLPADWQENQSINIEIGAGFVRAMMELYKVPNNPYLLAAAYNAGHTTVADGKVPPYYETVNHVRKVGAYRAYYLAQGFKSNEIQASL